MQDAMLPSPFGAVNARAALARARSRHEVFRDVARVGGWFIAADGPLLVFAFPDAAAAERFADLHLGMVLRGGLGDEPMPVRVALETYRE